MATFHPSLTVEKWSALSKDRQILNIAAELSRARRSVEKGHVDYVLGSLDRVLELTDLTVTDVKWKPTARRELLRWREILGHEYLAPTREGLQNALRVLLLFDPVSARVTV